MVDLAQTIEEWKDIQSVKVDDQVRDGQKEKKTKKNKKKSNRDKDKDQIQKTSLRFS